MRHRLLLVMLAVTAQSALCAEGVDTQALQKKISDHFPAIKIDSVQASVVPGWYEVVTADRLVYVDAAGTHLLLGQIMDIQTRENLTEKRWNEINSIDYQSLPFEHAIKIVKGNGSRQLVAFEDPLCPYCAELEKSLASLTDYTLHVFLLPLENLHPGATGVARSIWCADDPAATWTAWMQRDLQPEARSCDSVPITALAALAIRLKINSTPTLYFSDGIKRPGTLSADALEKHWAQQGK